MTLYIACVGDRIATDKDLNICNLVATYMYNLITFSHETQYSIIHTGLPIEIFMGRLLKDMAKVNDFVNVTHGKVSSQDIKNLLRNGKSLGTARSEGHKVGKKLQVEYNMIKNIVSYCDLTILLGQDSNKGRTQIAKKQAFSSFIPVIDIADAKTIEKMKKEPAQ